MSESDEALVRKSMIGDRASFEELVRRTARLVFSRVFLEVGDVHRAEDLVQETFLIAWRSIRQVSEPSGFRSWLFTIAHSVVVDAARRESGGFGYRPSCRARQRPPTRKHSGRSGARVR